MGRPLGLQDGRFRWVEQCHGLFAEVAPVAVLPLVVGLDEHAARQPQKVKGIFGGQSGYTSPPGVAAGTLVSTTLPLGSSVTANDVRPARKCRAAETDAVVGSGVRRRGLRLLTMLIIAFVAVVGVSLGRALLGPGTDSFAARGAEWARGHGLSAVIDMVERATYSAPSIGGRPAANSPLSGAQVAGTGLPATAVPVNVRSTLLRIATFASPPLPGEGTWQVLAMVGGKPALQVAYLRPDAVHTSSTAGVAWMDPRLLRFVLHPGTLEPGPGPWPQAPVITAAERPALVGAFNGGFRLDAARGGFFEGGRTVGKLREGAASLVIDATGRARVGQWGRDVHAGPAVLAVRQNLDLIVDAGKVAPGLADNARGRWGRTLGNKLYVWRSGVGQTASGALVYVSGDRLSAPTLAKLLRRAGSVRAMELDINPEWTSFVEYPAERNLLPDMQRSAHRYDSTSTRDFVTVLRRTS